MRMTALLALPSYRRFFLACAVASAPAYLPGALLPTIALAHGTTAGDVGLLMGTMAASATVARLVAPVAVPARLRFTALRGAHVGIAVGLVLWAGGPQFESLLVMAVVHGSALGTWTAMENAHIADTAPPARVGAVFGLVFLAPGLGVLVGPALAAAAMDRLGHAPVVLVAAGLLLAAGMALHPLERLPG
jgi:predicted MFS family arabinose efflux permease